MSDEATDTILYLVRHGETEYNRRRIVQGRGVDAELNETGHQQAEALAARFADVPLDAIYASSLRRAQQTAAAVHRHHENVPVAYLADLDEMAWGRYEGMGASDELTAAFAQFHDQWASGQFEDRVPGGESILDVETRARRALDYIVTRHPGQQVLAVTHGRLLRVLLASALAGYGLQRMQELSHSNTGVNHIRLSGGRFEALRLNCTAHLDVADYAQAS